MARRDGLFRLLFVAAPLTAAGAMNGAIFRSAWAGRRQEPSSLRATVLPPGWAVGLIWTILFSLLGFAMALCHEARDRVTLGAYALLVLVCLLYPIYTSGLRLAPSIIGNVAALLTAIHVSMVAATRQSRTVPYLAPLLIWLAFVNVAQATACAANV